MLQCVEQQGIFSKFQRNLTACSWSTRASQTNPEETGVPAFVVDVAELEGGFSVGTLQQAEVLTQEAWLRVEVIFQFNNGIL